MTRSTSYRISRGKIWTLLLFTAFVVVTSLACREGIGQSDNPRFNVDPTSITFSQVAIGSQAEREVVITNDGDGELVLRDIELVNDGGSAFIKAGNWPSEYSLGEDDHLVLTVIYEPVDVADHTGAIELATNDPNKPEVSIPIATQGLGGELFVSHPLVDFPQTPPGFDEYRFVELHNVGSAPLQIEDIHMSSGDHIFDISFPDERTTPIAQDSDTPASVLAHDGEPILVRVMFSPQDWDPAEGSFTIVSNDAYDPELEVEIRGNSGDTCLEVSHYDGVDFGPAAMGMDNKELITLRNCSPSADLELYSIEIYSDEDGVFDVDADSLSGGLADGGDHVLKPGDVTTAKINFHPTAEADYAGELLIASDDSRNEELILPITGHGVDGVCPEAVAMGFVDGASPTAEIHAAPQDIVELTAAGSLDPDGTQIEYEWAVIGRPNGSLADVDSPFSETTTFELDIVGHFLVELTVTDELGLTNCEPAVVEIFAFPTEDIHVQLVWSTPVVNQSYGGPDGEEEIGVDLDLHYVHPEAYWGDSKSVNFMRRDEDWEEHGHVTLDIDDRWGEDPENINHSDPLNGAFYRVGVHYYTNNGFGATDATVRVYFGIDLYGQYERRLHDTDNFWYVGNIQWNEDDPTFLFLDQFQATIDEIPSQNDIF